MEIIEKIIKYNSRDSYKIHPIGDIHLGAVHCDEDLLREEVVKIKKNPHAFWVGIGDYGDCITPSDLKRWDGRILAPWLLDDLNTKIPVWMRSNIDNIGPAQVRKVDEILSPIWGKCLGLIEGNHDDGIRKFSHYNFMKELLILANKKHEVPYAGVQCLINLKFQRNNSNEKHDIIIHARHGEGAARTSGARANAVLRMAMTMISAHITLMGHLHGQESPDIPERLILVRGKLKAFETIATMTGAWVKAYMQGVPPSYLERWGSPPSTLGCPVIEIKPSTGEMILHKTRRTQVL